MKLLGLFLFSIVIVFNLAIKNILRKQSGELSTQCNHRGYYYKQSCFCLSKYEGDKCQQNKKDYLNFSVQQCSGKIIRLDNLLNISPENYNGEDDQFPRLSGDSIGEGKPAYGKSSTTWIKMHDTSSTFSIFGKKISPKQVTQGNLGNCYLLAALASIAAVNNGDIIRNAFITQTDNQNHVYVTKWMIDGKSRFVAVDEWVPKGDNNQPVFAKPSLDGTFWAVILEKAWAKLHGEYLITDAGHPSDVFNALIYSPFNHKETNKIDNDGLFDLIQSLIDEGNVVTTYTYDEAQYEQKYFHQKQKLVPNHAYGILGVQQVESDHGVTYKLIIVFNPWNREYWEDNPWGAKGYMWSESMKQKYRVKLNNGAFHIKPQDFREEFMRIVWTETQKNYDILYKDIPFQNQKNLYTIKFNVKETTNQLIHIKFQNTYNMPRHSCKKPYNFERETLKILYEDGTQVYQSLIFPSATLKNLKVGNYIIQIILEKNYEDLKYFTVSIYCPIGIFQFEDMDQQNKCLNDCSNNGICIAQTQKCQCFQKYQGADCSQEIVSKGCPSDCNNNGKCDYSTGICQCEQGYIGEYCLPCKDKSEKCKTYVEQDMCNDNTMKNHLMNLCPKSCGESGAVDFQFCSTSYKKNQSENNKQDPYKKEEKNDIINNEKKDPFKIEENKINYTDCKDDFHTEFCEKQKLNGFCEIQPVFMKQNCKKTCRFC